MLNKTSGSVQGWRWSQRRCVAPSIRSIQDPARRGHRHASLRVVVKEGAKAEQSIDEPLEDFKHVVDVEQFRKLGYEVVDMICDYYKSLESYPVRSQVQPGYLRKLLPASAPKQPDQWQDVIKDFKDILMPGVTHWQSPSFFAYFAANSSFPAMLAEMLMTSLNMIGFSWVASPVATELEMVMMDWLAQMCSLPDKFLSTSGTGGGVIQGTSSEAVLVALLAAKARAMEGRPAEDATKLVAYSSDQAHSCFQKACMVAGITHQRVLTTSQQHEWALQPEALEVAMQQDLAQGLIPFYLCATIGTTSSCAVDPIAELTHVASRHNVWSHVDAAYAGSAAVLPEQQHFFGGLQHVDSYSFNPHKWMLVNFDCCAMWVADQAPLKAALSLTPVFLQGQANILDYKDWQVPLGRRFRSLKLFFVLRMYGEQQIQAYLRHHIALAQYFARLVQQDERFELAAPQRFGLVCFRLKGVGRQANAALLDEVNATGEVFMIHTELAGEYTIRLAVGSATTQQRHIDQAWQLLCETATEVLAKQETA